MYNVEASNLNDLLYKIVPYGFTTDKGENYVQPVELINVRGLNPDYESATDKNPDADFSPNSSDTVKTDGEGSKLYNKLHSGSGYPQSIIGKIHALSLEPVKDDSYGNTPYLISDLKDIDYHSKISKFSDLCGIREEGNNISQTLKQRRDLEFYESDFVYCKNKHYPLNRMITLRRFPYPCIDNIMDPTVQREQDVTRMVTFWDDQTNPLSDLLKFSYGLRWRKLEAGMEPMQMYGGDQEGLTGTMKKAALIFGDQELIKNRLRGNTANQVDPTHDTNKVYGPADSLTETYIRDIGFDYDQSFNIKFEYSMRAYNNRNPDAVFKDILANVLLCTYNDGTFWGGGRYWVGARPSKSTSMFKWMNSDNINDILNGGLKSIKDVMTKKFGTVEDLVETLKQIIKGGIQMAMANILDKVGRPGIPYSNSLLSGSPVGLWHLTIGHPLNPIMCVGNLICEGVDVEIPDVTLSYGDFPTKINFIVKLKPAMPKDRAGIEMMFNYGKQRLYMPCVVKVNKSKNAVKGSPNRDYIDIDLMLDKGEKEVINVFDKASGAFKGIQALPETTMPYITHSIDVGSKYIKEINKAAENAKEHGTALYYKSKKNAGTQWETQKTNIAEGVENSKVLIKKATDTFKKF